MSREKLGILASGRGSNFEAILDHIELDVLQGVDASVLVSDNPDAKTLEVAENRNISNYVVEPKNKEDREVHEERIYEIFRDKDVSLVILAGYMRIVSPYLLGKYEENIMNIHPSLLPAFKGMEAQKDALEYGAKVSGCTVHYAWKEVDAGPIITQKAVPIQEEDTVKKLSNRILVQEHRTYSKAIQLHADDRLEVDGRKVHVDYSDNWKKEWRKRQEAYIDHQKKSWKESEIYEEVFKK